jgi:hypothetical protein
MVTTTAGAESGQRARIALDELRSGRVLRLDGLLAQIEAKLTAGESPASIRALLNECSAIATVLLQGVEPGFGGRR